MRHGEIKVLRPKGGDKNPWCRWNRRDTAAARRTLASTRGSLAARFKGEGEAKGGGRDALLIGQHMARNNGLNCEKSEGENHGRVELAGAKIGEEGMTSRSRHQVGSTGQREREGKEKKRGRGLLAGWCRGRSRATAGPVRPGRPFSFFFCTFSLFYFLFSELQIAFERIVKIDSSQFE